jgi:hypothetical protein
MVQTSRDCATHRKLHQLKRDYISTDIYVSNNFSVENDCRKAKMNVQTGVESVNV